MCNFCLRSNSASTATSASASAAAAASAAAVVGARVSASTQLAPDKTRPLGYAADESIYATFRALSLLGLVLAIGMLVDNAVVVTESIFRHRAREKDKPFNATLKGVREVGTAVIAGTATTIIVFAPIIVGTKNDIMVFRDMDSKRSRASSRLSSKYPCSQMVTDAWRAVIAAPRRRTPATPSTHIAAAGHSCKAGRRRSQRRWQQQPQWFKRRHLQKSENSD